jgi:hypothetical protein
VVGLPFFVATNSFLLALGYGRRDHGISMAKELFFHARAKFIPGCYAGRGGLFIDALG